MVLAIAAGGRRGRFLFSKETMVPVANNVSRRESQRYARYFSVSCTSTRGYDAPGLLSSR